MNFTADYFSARIPDWERHTLHLDTRQCCCLEIGTFEGRSACWIAANLLNHPMSTLISVDPWNVVSPHQERQQENFAATANGRKIISVAQSSIDFYAETRKRGPTYDLIYIDGDHHGSYVIRDACNFWPQLQPGGILIFDDYQWVDSTGVLSENTLPRHAIDYFMLLFQDQYDVLHKEYQVFLRKRG